MSAKDTCKKITHMNRGIRKLKFKIQRVKDMSKHNVGSIQDKLCQSSPIKDAAEISLSLSIFDWGVGV